MHQHGSHTASIVIFRGDATPQFGGSGPHFSGPAHVKMCAKRMDLPHYVCYNYGTHFAISFIFMAPRKHLTVKEAKFVAAVVKLGNQTQAAIAAGYAPSGAAVSGSVLIKKPNVRQAVMEAIAQLDVASSIRKTHTAIQQLPIEGRDAVKNGELRLRAIDQISRIAGLDAPKRSERLTADLNAWLPTGDAVRVIDEGAPPAISMPTKDSHEK